MNKAIITLLLLSMPAICRADYELRLNDGVALTWREYTREGDRYCTQKEFGKFCIQKDDVSSMREVRGSEADATPSNKAEESRKTDRSKIKTIDGSLGGTPVVSVSSPQQRGRKNSTADLHFIVPSAQSGTIRWRYTFAAPPPNWMSPGFTDTGWKEGVAGFGADTPGAPIGTSWRSADIWMRREFTLAETPSKLPCSLGAE